MVSQKNFLCFKHLELIKIEHKNSGVCSKHGFSLQALEAERAERTGKKKTKRMKPKPVPKMAKPLEKPVEDSGKEDASEERDKTEDSATVGLPESETQVSEVTLTKLY